LPLTCAGEKSGAAERLLLQIAKTCLEQRTLANYSLPKSSNFCTIISSNNLATTLNSLNDIYLIQ
jgi:hypothetical protein